MLISPTEPAKFRVLGSVSSVPEKLGCDFLFISQGWGKVGVQRKEVSDLINSVHDGRLQKELAQMQALGLGVLLIEGRLQWTTDGSLLGRSKWTLKQYRGLLWSVQSRNYWIGQTESLDDSINWISNFETWVQKEKHQSLTVRPKIKGAWGSPSSREWGIHLLQSFEGIGAEVAGRIYDELGVPLAWTVTGEELQTIKGLGKKRAERLIETLRYLYEQ